MQKQGVAAHDLGIRPSTLAIHIDLIDHGKSGGHAFRCELAPLVGRGHAQSAVSRAGGDLGLSDWLIPALHQPTPDRRSRNNLDRGQFECASQSGIVVRSLQGSPNLENAMDVLSLRDKCRQAGAIALFIRERTGGNQESVASPRGRYLESGPQSRTTAVRHSAMYRLHESRRTVTGSWPPDSTGRR